ncbi:MAG: HTH domain-containing protein, partial [Candidatus Delongbacteria bacterium]
DVSGKNIGKVSGKIMVEISDKLVNIFKKNPTITIRELSQRLGFHERTIYRYVRRLKQDKILFRVGTDKKGYWEIIEND